MRKTDNRLPRLNFPPIRLRCTKRNSEVCVWDELRRSYLVLTPEEWVRRHVIGWLVGKGIAPTRIAQEHPVNLNEQSQRADIVVFGDDTKPMILIECKATTVPLSADVFNQAVRYNSVIKARYLMLTNGLEHRLYSFDGYSYFPQQLDSIVD